MSGRRPGAVKCRERNKEDNMIWSPDSTKYHDRPCCQNRMESTILDEEESMANKCIDSGCALWCWVDHPEEEHRKGGCAPAVAAMAKLAHVELLHESVDLQRRAIEGNEQKQAEALEEIKRWSEE